MAIFKLKQMMLDAISSSAEQATKLVNEFNWDKTKEELSENGDRFVKFGASLVEDVKKSLGMVKEELDGFSAFKVEKASGRYSLTLPYSKADGDRLKWKVSDRTLIVSIERSTEWGGKGNMKTEFKETIPEGCGERPSSIKADKSRKTATFVFDLEEDEEFEEI